MNLIKDPRGFECKNGKKWLQKEFEHLKKSFFFARKCLRVLKVKSIKQNSSLRNYAFCITLPKAMKFEMKADFLLVV